MRPSSLRQSAFLPLAFIIFAASGFAGLIYESIWSHYLKLFLGHAAYAQIPGPGDLHGRHGDRRLEHESSLAALEAICWIAYAAVELLIGAMSLVFHGIYLTATDLAFERVTPALGSPAVVQIFKWTLAAALILPQSVLLGATVSADDRRRAAPAAERAGYARWRCCISPIASAPPPACVGRAVSISSLRAGLPGTLAAAGVVNLAVAAAVFVMRPPRAALHGAGGAGRGDGGAASEAPAYRGGAHWRLVLHLRDWLDPHAVAGPGLVDARLRVDAFRLILGIAFGGLAIRRRIDATGEPLRLLDGCKSPWASRRLATLPVYGSTFVAMRAAFMALARRRAATSPSIS